MKIQSISMNNTKQNPAFGAYIVPRNLEGYEVIKAIKKDFHVYKIKPDEENKTLTVFTSLDLKQFKRLLSKESITAFKRCVGENAKMLGLADVNGKSKDEIGSLIKYTIEDFFEKLPV